MELDPQRLAAVLQKPAFKSPDLSLATLSVQVYETVDSTNRVLWELLDRGAAAGTVVIARQQQSGRGQWGRQWQSPPGGLYLSIALALDILPTAAGQLTLCSAWGIAEALRSQGVPVALKWLNDLVVQGRKLGGILTETRMHQGRITQAVVGVGINWANHAPPPGINLQTLRAQQPDVAIDSLEMLAATVLRGVQHGYHRWQQQGIEALLPDYQSLLVNLGQAVSWHDQTGRVVGVAPGGELRVCFPSQEDAARSIEVCLQPGTISLGYG